MLFLSVSQIYFGIDVTLLLILLTLLIFALIHIAKQSTKISKLSNDLDRQFENSQTVYDGYVKRILFLKLDHFDLMIRIAHDKKWIEVGKYKELHSKHEELSKSLRQVQGCNAASAKTIERLTIKLKEMNDEVQWILEKLNSPIIH
jgi:hypothetical protein